MNELIEKARNGDKDAFLEVYSSNRKNLYKYCRNLCGNDADAHISSSLKQQKAKIHFSPFQPCRTPVRLIFWQIFPKPLQPAEKVIE